MTGRGLASLVVKRAPARVLKAAGQAGSGLAPGQFEAIVSVFGNKDSYGDVMMTGSFAGTLADWKASGNPIPVIWSHDWMDPESHIGWVLDSREVAAGEIKADSPPGLWVLAQNDIEANPRAVQVSRLLAGGRVTQFSFAYDELNAGWGMWEGDEAWLVHAVALHEVGPTLLGANRDTMLVGAKGDVGQAARVIIDLARRLKAGSRHSTADLASLNGIHAALMDLGISCDAAAQPDDGKSAPAKAGEVTSDNDRGTNGQGSTDEGADGTADDAGSSNLRTAGDVRASLELAFAEGVGGLD